MQQTLSMDLIDRVLDTICERRTYCYASCAATDRGKAPWSHPQLASSSAYFYGGNAAALYWISKTVVVRMIETLAVEWAKFNINVNAIAPGACSSEMMDAMLDHAVDLTKVPRPIPTFLARVGSFRSIVDAISSVNSSTCGLGRNSSPQTRCSNERPN